MRKKIVILAIGLLFVLGTQAFAASSEIVEIRPTVQLIKNAYAPQEEPMDIQEDFIAYDSPPVYYFPGYTDIGTSFSVRFTPVQACSLVYLEIVTYSGDGNAKIHIWSDDSGNPGQDLVTPFNRVLNGNLQYQRVNFDAIDIGNNEFHAGIEYTRNPPPYITTDGDGVTENRSKVKFPEGAWQVLENDLNIRAYVIYYGDDNIAPTVTHSPLIRGFSQGDSIQDLSGENTIFYRDLITADVFDASGTTDFDIYYDTGGGYQNEDFFFDTDDSTYKYLFENYPVGTNVSYYLKAVDSSGNAGYAPADSSASPYTFEVTLGAGLYYDDGEVDGWWIVDDSGDSNAFAVRGSPARFPAIIRTLSAYVNSTDSFEFAVYGYSAGRPTNEILGGPWRTAAASAPGWTNLELSAGQRVTIDSTVANFCVAFRWLSGQSTAPAVGGDNDSPNGNSFWKTDSIWVSDPTNDLMLRSTVVYPPIFPQTIAPTDGEEISDLNVDLIWENLYSADSYYIQVDNDNLFGSPAAQVSTGDTLYDISSSLADGSWYWRIRGYNTYAGWGGYGSAHSFTVTPPQLVSPADGSNVTTTPVELVWNMSLNADSFLVQMDSSGFEGDSIYYETVTTDTTVDVTAQVVANTEFSWRARAYSSVGSGAYSETWTFTYTGSPTGVDNPRDGIPNDYALNQAYPNPFNAVTMLNYAIPENQHVTLKIYNLFGQLVDVPVDEYQTAGYKSVTWDASNYASGIYFYKLEAGDYVSTKKMSLLK
ncbi:MAG: T9SS type A sorting domain-containing protein [candidate division Zixibacteria bacterium]|nr:T9SS type A sorting domain-containing protein [candidate division Zixibacteria bacterium]